MAKNLRPLDLIHFMVFFWNDEVCVECGEHPSYQVGKDPLCGDCMTRLHVREEEEDHRGMVQGYDGEWRWL